MAEVPEELRASGGPPASVEPLTIDLDHAAGMLSWLSVQRRQPIRRLSDPSTASNTTFALLPPISPIIPSDTRRQLPIPEEIIHIISRNENGREADQALHINDTKPLPPHACKSTDCSVNKVFNSPELLESLIRKLPPVNLPTLRHTASIWNSIIAHSPYVRVHSFAHPQFGRPASEFILLPLRLSGLDIRLGEPVASGQWLHVSLIGETAKRILHTSRPVKRVRSRSIYEGLRGGLGPKTNVSPDKWPLETETKINNHHWEYADLYPIQPPVVGMQAYLITNKATSPSSSPTLPPPDTDEHILTTTDHGPRNSPDTPPAPCAKIHCDAGITLGFLAETTSSLLSKHKQTRSDNNHQSEPKIEFRCIISFCNSPATPRARSKARRDSRTVTLPRGADGVVIVGRSRRDQRVVLLEDGDGEGP